jgi:dihydroorotase
MHHRAMPGPVVVTESGVVDLVVRGGTLVNPGGIESGAVDIAVSGDRIVAIERAVSVAASEELDAKGLFVVPGLVDMHTHVFHGATYWGVDPDAIAGRAGVTHWVDAGSAGAYSIDAFDRWVVAESDVHINAFINLSTIGLVGENYELSHDDFCDVDLCVEMARRHSELVVGIKVRIDRGTVGDFGLEPLTRAVVVAEALELPLMVHISEGPPSVDTILAMLRPGDIITHYATGASMKLVDERGKVRAAAREAQARGVRFDVGHGVGSFSWNSAQALVEGGVPPDVISSDIHQCSLAADHGDLLTCLSKYLHLGLGIEEVLAAATSRPAALLGLPGAGVVEVGGRADLALLRVDIGEFDLVDVDGDRRQAARRLRCESTVLGGRILPQLASPVVYPWASGTDGSSAT